jgi:hypothetical protein
MINDLITCIYWLRAKINIFEGRWGAFSRGGKLSVLKILRKYLKTF